MADDVFVAVDEQSASAVALLQPSILPYSIYDQMYFVQNRAHIAVDGTLAALAVAPVAAAAAASAVPIVN